MEMRSLASLKGPSDDTIWAQESLDIASGIYELRQLKGDLAFVNFTGRDEAS